MLTKENRLRNDKDFKKVFKLSRPVYAGRLALRKSENRFGLVRFGFVISNKIDKRATRRNGLKRRLRAKAKELISGVKPGYDVLVVVKESYPFPYNYKEISADMEGGLRKLDLKK